LLPHLDALHRHPLLITLAPGGVPRIVVLPKFFGSGGTLVAPRFVADFIWEETIGAANRNVEDQVEWMIERSASSASLRPRIEECRMINDLLSKVAAIPHVAFGVELDEEDLLPRC